MLNKYWLRHDQGVGIVFRTVTISVSATGGEARVVRGLQYSVMRFLNARLYNTDYV